MRDAEAWCAAGIVGPGRPLLVTSSALPMMLGLSLRDPVAFAFEAPAIATGFPLGFFTHDGPGPEFFGVPPTVPPWPSRLAVLAWPKWDQHSEETSFLRVSHLGPARLLFPVNQAHEPGCTDHRR